MKCDRRRRGQSRRACLDFRHAPRRVFSSDAVTALRLSIIGRVQGVGYRAWAVHEAMRRSLRGWVRNRRDGSVEALIIGDADAVAGMLAACRRGPPLAQVLDVRPNPADDDGSTDFSEVPTD
jgi:acylphosphatase